MPQLNLTLIPAIGHHTPAGTSAYTIIHYGQEINSNGFHAFDYGKDGNEEIYGQTDPPEYEIEKITAPVAVYWADNDWLAQREVSTEQSCFLFEILCVNQIFNKADVYSS